MNHWTLSGHVVSIQGILFLGLTILLHSLSSLLLCWPSGLRLWQVTSLSLNPSPQVLEHYKTQSKEKVLIRNINTEIVSQTIWPRNNADLRRGIKSLSSTVRIWQSQNCQKGDLARMGKVNVLKTLFPLHIMQSPLTLSQILGRHISGYKIRQIHDAFAFFLMPHCCPVHCRI